MSTTHQLLNEEALTLSGSNPDLTFARIWVTPRRGVQNPLKVLDTSAFTSVIVGGLYEFSRPY
jgi:hypothetical protein